MSKVFLGTYDKYTYCLVNNGKVVSFDLNGRLSNKDVAIFDIQGLQEVDVLSVLSTDYVVELGLNIDGAFDKKVVTVRKDELDRYFRSMDGLIFVASRGGSIDGKKFSQFFYIYLKSRLNKGRILECVK